MASSNATVDALASNVKVEDVGPARKRLTFTIPADAVNSRLEDSMSTFAASAQLPGFRKGRVPRDLIRRRFGSAMRDETRSQLIANAYAAAIEANNLKPVGEPEPAEGVETPTLEEGKPLTYAVEIEVLPDFELPKIDGLSVYKPMLEIADKHVHGELERQRYHLGKPQRIESDFKEGDRIGGSVKAWKNGEEEPFFTADDAAFVMPSPEKDDGRGSMLGVMVDNLAQMLDGKRIGDTFTVETVGPESHEREDLRNAKLKIEFAIKIAQRVDPISVEEVVAHYGLESLDILTEQIKIALEHRRDEEQAAAMRDQALEQVGKLVDFPLPEKMSQKQAARNLERLRLDLLYRGLTPEEVEEQLAVHRAASESNTRQRLKMFFLIHRFAESFNVTVSEQEINGRLAFIAAQRGVRPDALRSELQQAGRLNDLASQIRDQKTADRIVQQTKQVEINAEDWHKMLAEKQAAAKANAPSIPAPRRKPTAPAKKEEPAAKSAKAEEKPATKKKTSKK